MPAQRTGLTINGGQGVRFERFTINYAICQEYDTGTNAPVPLLTAAQFPKGSVILGVRIKHSTAFSGGAVGACTVSVGISGDLTRFAAAFDIFQAVAAATKQLSTQFKDADNAAAIVYADFNTVGANISALTAGQVDIDLLYLPMGTVL